MRCSSYKYDVELIFDQNFSEKQIHGNESEDADPNQKCELLLEIIKILVKDDDLMNKAQITSSSKKFTLEFTDKRLAESIRDQLALLIQHKQDVVDFYDNVPEWYSDTARKLGFEKAFEKDNKIESKKEEAKLLDIKRKI